jgi:hypothetical protein
MIGLGVVAVLLVGMLVHTLPRLQSQVPLNKWRILNLKSEAIFVLLQAAEDKESLLGGTLGYLYKCRLITHSVAICHMDTTLWASEHPAFAALDIPRGTEACHWNIQHDLIWIQKEYWLLVEYQNHFKQLTSSLLHQLKKSKLLWVATKLQKCCFVWLLKDAEFKFYKLDMNHVLHGLQLLLWMFLGKKWELGENLHK